MKLGTVVLISGGLATVALLIALQAAKAKASPEIPKIPAAEIPTRNDILASQSIAELNAYYNLISELFIIGKIDRDTYQGLYDAYYDRWHELLGVS